MTATNATGWEIELFDEKLGWQPEYAMFGNRAEAEAMLKMIPDDGRARRVYETLEPHK